MATRISEVLAAKIMQLAKQNEQAAFDAILKLVRENKELKKRVKYLENAFTREAK